MKLLYDIIEQDHLSKPNYIPPYPVELASLTYGDYVFANEHGRVYARVISDCIRNKCIQEGIPIKSIHALRRTLNSKMRCEGVSPVVASSILGHTEKVNNSNYTYDISDNKYKMDIISGINKEIMKAVK